MVYEGLIQKFQHQRIDEMGILVEFQQINQYDQKNYHYKFSSKPFHKAHQVQTLICERKNQKRNGEKMKEKKTYNKKNSNFLLQAQQKIEQHHKRGNIIEKNQKKT
jgi:hypothetical protein